MGRVKRWLQKLYAIYIKRDEKAIAYYRYMDEGGEALRLDYPLRENSVVIDVGGYIGDFASDITGKSGCKIDVFEPVAEYAEKIRERFSSNENVQVIQAGLGASDKDEVIRIEGLGSSVFGDSAGDGSKEKIKIVSAVDYIESKAYPVIDLMKINIEGGEFELLNALLEHPDLIRKIRYFQIQFHDFVPDARNMRDELRKRLSETHQLMWDYPFIWESWKLSENEKGVAV
jgi:FkbM family methyltransferase